MIGFYPERRRLSDPAFNGLDQAELEAARAQGFRRRQVLAFITLPQVLRLSMPGL